MNRAPHAKLFPKMVTVFDPAVRLFVFLVLISTQQLFSQSSSIKNGQIVYTTFCQSCHQENGEGVPSAFPPLAKASNLNDKNRLVQIILKGMRGEITVKSVKYNVEMAAIDLKDQEVADVINYIRNSWGNKAPLITVGDVVAAKKAVVKGLQPF